MDVFLPDTASGLESLEESLSVNGWESLLADMAPRSVEVQLPKFTMGMTLDLTEGLKAMGVVDAFVPELADFSGMTGKRDLYLSKMYQEALIAVTEEGTTASGSGVFALRKPASAPSFTAFTADHPFTFLIWNKVTQVVLYVGHFVKPGAKDGI